MAFTISPSVIVQERDISLAVVQLANFIGATAGYTQWGAASKPTLITGGEDDFIGRFYKPDANTYLDILTMNDFLSYSSKAWFTRVVGSAARNAVEGGNNPVLVRNEDEAEAGTFTGTQWMAKYPGALGNGITVDIADSTKFPTWEFRGQFSYTPAAGEFAVAVIDGSGLFTGSGQAKQTERLTVYNRASGGIHEARGITLSGTVTGGTSQVEALTFTGTSTGTSITVDGQAVTIAVSDTASQVATKVAAALAAITATYTSATASGAIVTVTYKTPALRTAIASGTSVGVSWSSVITTPGSDVAPVTLYGVTLATTYGQTATQVAALLAPALALQTNVYSSAIATGAVVNTIATPYGVSAYPSTVQTSGGVTATTAITTAGSSNFNITVFGVTVALVDQDTSDVVATKIAAALLLDTPFTTTYENIIADKAAVQYNQKVVGSKTAKVAPATQGGLDFAVDVNIPGRLGSILERYEIMTTDKKAKFPDGTTRYFADAINKGSKYIFVADTTLPFIAETVTLSGGLDDYTLSKAGAIAEYANSEKMDVNYIWVATNNVVEQKAVIDVVDTRRDAIAFVAPTISDVVNQRGNELANVTAWRSTRLNRDSSYAFNTDNWALVYDKYNDVNRWIPTCGGTAGLLARSSQDFDPWISPAGHQRGRYKNYIRLAWSASKAQRDELYKIGVNSAVEFPAEGILLYGDKTSTSRPSSFSRINVRMAFIVAEKSIANFARQFLFELNDEFTRSQFLNAVRPFLRGMIGRKAFSDARVIADTRNNTSQVIAENTMVGSILLKPLYSINFIVLDFAAVGANITFEEVEKQLG